MTGWGGEIGCGAGVRALNHPPNIAGQPHSLPTRLPELWITIGALRYLMVCLRLYLDYGHLAAHMLVAYFVYGFRSFAKSSALGHPNSKKTRSYILYSPPIYWGWWGWRGTRSPTLAESAPSSSRRLFHHYLERVLPPFPMRDFSPETSFLPSLHLADIK